MSMGLDMGFNKMHFPKMPKLTAQDFAGGSVLRFSPHFLIGLCAYGNICLPVGGEVEMTHSICENSPLAVIICEKDPPRE